MKFLIDECLHASLVGVARDRGHAADHVCWVGKSGWKDWDLMPFIAGDDFTFVTENREDFLRLFAQEEAHNGLVVFMKKSRPPLQRELFAAVLDELGTAGDLFNQAIKVEFEGSDQAATAISIERIDLSRPA